MLSLITQVITEIRSSGFLENRFEIGILVSERLIDDRLLEVPSIKIINGYKEYESVSIIKIYIKNDSGKPIKPDEIFKNVNIVFNDVDIIDVIGKDEGITNLIININFNSNRIIIEKTLFNPGDCYSLTIYIGHNSNITPIIEKVEGQIENFSIKYTSKINGLDILISLMPILQMFLIVILYRTLLFFSEKVYRR